MICRFIFSVRPMKRFQRPGSIFSSARTDGCVSWDRYRRHSALIRWERLPRQNWIESKGIKPESIITKIIPLEKIIEGFQELTRPIKEEIKILVEP